MTLHQSYLCPFSMLLPLMSLKEPTKPPKPLTHHSSKTTSGLPSSQRPSPISPFSLQPQNHSCKVPLQTPRPLHSILLKSSTSSCRTHSSTPSPLPHLNFLTYNTRGPAGPKPNCILNLATQSSSSSQKHTTIPPSSFPKICLHPITPSQLTHKATLSTAHS